MSEPDETLDTLLDRAGRVVRAQGWLSTERWTMVDFEIRQNPQPAPMVGRSVVSAALLERKLLTREQATDLDALLVAQRLFKDFHLQRKLGSGGMGTVFLAREAASDTLVALKTINTRLAQDKDFVERFHREARALQSLDHPHVARILAVGEEAGHCWLAMEYIQGPSLMGLLKKHRVLPEAWCVQVARQIALGLGYVWSTASLVHRDLKPENILVMSDDVTVPPVAKLIDFGLVKNNQEDNRLTQTGMTIGTPLYMSPEQVRGERLDCRSDIYGLGATIFHLLTGGTPYNGNSPGSIMSAHLTEPVPDPASRVPSLSSATRSLVMTCMAKMPEHRFLTCEALVQACDQALAALDPQRADAPRLLRKPLVIKTPARAERTPLANEVLPPLPMPLPEPAKSAASDRRRAERHQGEYAASAAVPAQHTQEHTTAQLAPTEILQDPPTAPLVPNPKRQTLGPPRRFPSPLPVPSGVTPVPSGAAPVPAPRATPSRTPPPRTAAPSTPLPAAPPRPSTPLEEPPGTGGVGWLPWLVLAGAVLLLLAYLVLA